MAMIDQTLGAALYFAVFGTAGAIFAPFFVRLSNDVMGPNPWISDRRRITIMRTIATGIGIFGCALFVSWLRAKYWP